MASTQLSGGSARPRRLRLLLVALGVALLSGAVAETGLTRFAAREMSYNLMGQNLRGVTASTTHDAEVRSAAATFALLGALLGAAFGALGASERGARPWAAAAGGALAGAVAAVLASSAILPIRSRLVMSGGSEFATSILGHAGVWVPVGLAVGGAYGCRREMARLSMLGGLGALAAAAAFDLAAPLVFPLALTGEPIAGSAPSRLLAQVMIGLGIAAFLTAGRGTPCPPAGSDLRG